MVSIFSKNKIAFSLIVIIFYDDIAINNTLSIIITAIVIYTMFSGTYLDPLIYRLFYIIFIRLIINNALNVTTLLYRLCWLVITFICLEVF